MPPPGLHLVNFWAILGSPKGGGPPPPSRLPLRPPWRHPMACQCQRIPFNSYLDTKWGSNWRNLSFLGVLLASFWLLWVPISSFWSVGLDHGWFKHFVVLFQQVLMLVGLLMRLNMFDIAVWFILLFTCFMFHDCNRCFGLDSLAVFGLRYKRPEW